MVPVWEGSLFSECTPRLRHRAKGLLPFADKYSPAFIVQHFGQFSYRPCLADLKYLSRDFIGVAHLRPAT